MKKEIKQALDQITKKFGDEAIMLLGQKDAASIDTFSSGSLVIDELTGVGGYPRGRVIEIYGLESSGKTTLSLHAIAEVQKMGGIAAFVDAEHALDPSYARELGVDIDNLILSQPDSGEQGLEIVDLLAKSGEIDLIVVDSVAALVPESELKGEMSDQTIGAQARLMSKALRKITASLSKNKTTVIFINQVRSRIGVFFGNPQTTSGGRALKFYASLRLEVRRSGSIGSPELVRGNQIKIKVVKNKLAAPFKVGLSEIIFSKGISQESEILQLAKEKNIITLKGSWYQYEGQNLAQGKEKTILFIAENKSLAKKLLQEIKDKSD